MFSVTSDDFPASRRVPIELDAARAAATGPVSGRRALRRADADAQVTDANENDDWSLRGFEFRGATWFDGVVAAGEGPTAEGASTDAASTEVFWSREVPVAEPSSTNAPFATGEPWASSE